MYLSSQIELVKKEMAWESEKHQIALNKIKQRFECVSKIITVELFFGLLGLEIV